MSQADLIDFLLLRDHNVFMVVLGTVILGGSAALVGSFSFLRKQSLIGDAVAHSILPGVVLAFLLSGSKNPLYLMIGALISGWISIRLINRIVTSSKLKTDAAIAIVLSFFFAIGIVLLTYAQHNSGGNMTGLDHYLFGKAASMNSFDVQVFASMALLLFVLVLVFRRAFILISFDRDFAISKGLQVKIYEWLLSSLTILAIALGIQAVGMILMAALIITPAAAARQWSNKMGVFIALTILFGMISGYFGSFLSYSAPQMPTGPWIVMVLSFITFISVIFAPEKGIVSRQRKKKNNKRKILTENVLKSFYHIGEVKDEIELKRSLDELNVKLKSDKDLILKGLSLLKQKGFTIQVGDLWALTSSGITESRRIVRLHRLWELYLTKKMLINPSFVHHDAEAIEHVITPEIEFQLTKELENPEIDPHQSQIPKIRR
jgi:manganese/zinc/iron transport system permease protein